jgi:hypothetical protein
MAKIESPATAKEMTHLVTLEEAGACSYADCALLLAWPEAVSLTGLHSSVSTTPFSIGPSRLFTAIHIALAPSYMQKQRIIDAKGSVSVVK